MRKPKVIKSGETRSKKAKEKQAKQTAEVETRKLLAAQFLKAASPSENLDNFTNKDITIINDSNGRENRQMTAEHKQSLNQKRLHYITPAQQQQLGK